MIAEEEQLTADDVELRREQRGTGDDRLGIGGYLVEHLPRRRCAVDQVGERADHLRVDVELGEPGPVALPASTVARR